jgi:hypothetical protein
MGKYSAKMMGKEVGDAMIYAEPHTMDGKPLRQTKMSDPNKQSAEQTTPMSGSKRVSAGDPGRDDVKTSGIKIRGTGCATKGVMARGPMG